MARVRRGGPRRLTQWGGFGHQDGATVQRSTMVTVASGSVGILSSGIIVGGAYGFLDERVTITRMIGLFVARVQTDTAALAAQYAVGCAKATAQAIAAGTASLADPENEPDFEWLYYQAGNLRRSGTANNDNGLTTVQMPFDVRSQRILQAADNVVWLLAARCQSVEAGVGGRYLAKLA